MTQIVWAKIDQIARERLLETVVTIAGAASDLLMRFYAQSTVVDVQLKMDNSPVTAADIAAHQLIEEGLLNIWSDIGVLSEESAVTSVGPSCEMFWLVDPLDGTKEFIHKTDEFTVNIALIVNGSPVLSVLAVPAQQLIYAGAQHVAVYKVKQGVRQPLLNTMGNTHVSSLNIAISRRASSKELAGYTAFFDQLNQAGIEYHLIEAGSAYKFCLMLEGTIDVYPRLHPTSEWDTAAGQGLLEYTGGGLFNLRGKAFSYNERDSLINGSFIAVRRLELKKALMAARVVG